MAVSTVLLVAALLSTTTADFSPSFRAFIQTTYGTGTLNALARTDLGAAGSYGGGLHTGLSPTTRTPIVLVHGTTNSAGTFATQAAYFRANGWSEETVYATTYGDAGNTTVTNVKMLCEYVQQIRNMIIAVNAFTQQKVNVIGYSMGSPIARKAILGGKCAENTVQLGAPLTSIIETYISVAGANRGTSLCDILFAPLVVPTCNTKNGLKCSSDFLTDIRSVSAYEGQYIFSIYGPSDDKVGFNTVCGRVSRIDGATAEKDNVPGNHDAIIANTVGATADLLTNHAF